MRYASIRKMDITNGPGIRVSLFTQGCDLHCKGCFNWEIWDYNAGNVWTNDTKEHLLTLCNKVQIKGLSILGGEPLSMQNYVDLIDLFKSFKNRYKNKDIWLWTGYTFEKLNRLQLEVIQYIDVLVDGAFEIDKADFKLKFRGSSNQRIIDVKESLKQNKVIEKEID